jgi:hypothetical protein
VTGECQTTPPVDQGSQGAIPPPPPTDDTGAAEPTIEQVACEAAGGIFDPVTGECQTTPPAPTDQGTADQGTTPPPTDQGQDEGDNEDN